MSVRAFGSAALGDPDFVASLGRGRSPRLVTADRVLAFMGDAPVGPAFRAEVEAFLAATGIKRSVLGLGATRNPSFVAHLRRGTSPMLSTVGRVRGWMAANASATEARAIERRIGTMPDILAADPMRWQIPPSEICTPSTVGVQGYAGTGKTAMLNRARALAEKKGFRMSGPEGRCWRGASGAAGAIIPASRPAPASQSNSRGRPLPTGANPCRKRPGIGHARRIGNRRMARQR